MANAITNVDLADLHDAIVRDIQAQFPALKIVQFYREETDREAPKPEELPACLLSLCEMEPAPDVDPGTEQLAVHARFEARLIVGFRTPQAKLEVRKLAGAFAAWLRLRRWSHPNPTKDGQTLPTGPAYVISIMPDDFSPVLDRFEVWTVEWLQDTVHLGNTIWTDEGMTPGHPMYSWLPDIGTGNEDKYQPAIPDAGAQ
ncbi:hypothetical protein AB7813_08385 [Tardiphaga sp. 20_F10_N6_6]|uniref:hypothetical protein n=1 Tax=Tardiphaga sp. 20_F10_N6_6 TaxID=3240788 RepID=UPI003F8B694E